MEAALLARRGRRCEPNTIFRVAHSIKGGSATFGFSEVAASPTCSRHCSTSCAAGAAGRPQIARMCARRVWCDADRDPPEQADDARTARADGSAGDHASRRRPPRSAATPAPARLHPARRRAAGRERRTRAGAGASARPGTAGCAMATTAADAGRSSPRRVRVDAARVPGWGNWIRSLPAGLKKWSAPCGAEAGPRSNNFEWAYGECELQAIGRFPSPPARTARTRRCPRRSRWGSWPVHCPPGGAGCAPENRPLRRRRLDPRGIEKNRRAAFGRRTGHHAIGADTAGRRARGPPG